MPPINEIPAEQPVGKKPAAKPTDPAQPAKPTFDGKKYLERTLPRKAGEFLKVVPIPHTDSFRINWYDLAKADNPAIPGLSITYIRESKFLFCKLGPDGNPVITYPEKQ